MRKTTKPVLTVGTFQEAIAASPYRAATYKPSANVTVTIYELAKNWGWRLEKSVGRGASVRRVFCSDYDTLGELLGFAPEECGVYASLWMPVMKWGGR